MAIIVGPTNWQFRANIPNLGSTFRGGNLICKSGGQVWIVAPQSTEVQNDWYTAAPGAVYTYFDPTSKSRICL
jgi:hypothetical protein